MTDVIYYVAASIDGFIATSDGGVEWLAPFEAADGDYGYHDFYSGIDAMILGSRTYEQVLTFGKWPYSDKPTWVLSSRDLGDAPGGITVSSASPEDAVSRLSASGAQRIWLVGGGELAGSFARAGLITTCIISFMPVLLGHGVPLFGSEGASAATLQLKSLERYGDVVQCTYRME